ncbi:MAG: protein translocase subunit SecF, partial [Chromatiales bacterium]|nr:protein translocase subunit SecF [Chromatiales bacterium]
MQILSKPTNIDFVGRRKLAAWVSIVLIVLSIASLAVRGLQFGIDFTGGTLVEVGYPDTADVQGARNALNAAGFGEAVVQYFGTPTEILVRIAPRNEVDKATLSEELQEALETAHGAGLEMRRVEFVGPQVGEELREDGGIAMLIALAGILLYVLFRFEWRFAIGSVCAL